MHFLFMHSDWFVACICWKRTLVTWLFLYAFLEYAASTCNMCEDTKYGWFCHELVYDGQTRFGHQKISLGKAGMEFLKLHKFIFGSVTTSNNLRMNGSLTTHEIKTATNCCNFTITIDFKFEIQVKFSNIFNFTSGQIQMQNFGQIWGDFFL